MRIRLDRAGDESHRLIQALAPVGEHVAQVVERLRVLRIPIEHPPERPLGVGEPVALLEDRAEQEQNRRLFRELRLRRLEHQEGFAQPVVLAVEGGHGQVRPRHVAVLREHLQQQILAPRPLRRAGRCRSASMMARVRFEGLAPRARARSRTASSWRSAST